MSTSKKTPPAIVGRRLRRYLGALLVLGFGATWWSFVPPKAAQAAPAVARAPHAVKRVTAHAGHAPEPGHSPTIRVAAMPRVRVHRRHHAARPPMPPPIDEPTAVPSLDTSSLTGPIEMPSNEVPDTAMPEPKIVIDPGYIRTRSSS